MTTLGTTFPTLLDFSRRMEPDGSISKIIEVLNQTNEVLEDMVMVEANGPRGHVTTIRKGLPTPTWRLFNQGVTNTKSQTLQVTDDAGMLEAYAEVDKALADLNGNSAAWRLSEELPHLEGMNQEMAGTVFYGNTRTDPEQFFGLSPRFATPSTTITDSGYNMINGGGTGTDNTSIWLVVWGPNTVHGFFPKGSKAGFTIQDKGQVTIENVGGVSGAKMEGYRTHYKWDLGMSVRDWRYVVRICNIDVSNLAAEVNAANLMKLMIKATEIVPNLGAGMPRFYMNSRVRTALRLQMLDKSNVFLNLSEVAGKRVMTFAEIPVRRVDQILTNEDTITGTFFAH